jgi:putative hydrolase of the HAD superfamily
VTADALGEGAVTTIVFDMTGVITRSPLKEIEAYGKRLGLRPGVLRAFFRTEAFQRVLLGRLSMGALVDDIVATVGSEHGRVVSPEELRAAMRASQQIEPLVAELITELAGRYRLAVLTNNTTDLVDPDASGSPQWWSEDGDAPLRPSDFAVVMSSSDLGMTKPDPRIYQELLCRLEVRGDEVVYIDDQATNLTAATTLGMRTIHYRDADQCRDALRRQGVVVGERKA